MGLRIRISKRFFVPSLAHYCRVLRAGQGQTRVKSGQESWWNMQFLQVLGLGVTAKVRTSHGPTTEEILQAYREGPNASAREEPKAPATTTRRLAAADIRLSVLPLGSQLLSVGLRAIG